MSKAKAKVARNEQDEYRKYKHHPVKQMNSTELAIMRKLILTQSVSGKTREMNKLVNFILSKIKKDKKLFRITNDKHGNILVTKGAAKTFPAVACHLDTVHPIVTDYKVMVWSNPADSRRQWLSPTGIGGDDKNGIWTVLTLLMNDDIPSLKAFFFNDEEIGAIGAKAAASSWFDDVAFIIESDRRGSTDLIFAAGGESSCSKDFQEIVEKTTASRNFTVAKGSFTDVMKIQTSINVSVMNISNGHYNPHHADEFIDESDMIGCRDAIVDILKALGTTPRPYVRPVKVHSAYNYSFDGYSGQSYKTPYNWSKSKANTTTKYGGRFLTKDFGMLHVKYEIISSPTGKRYFWTISNEATPFSMLPGALEVRIKSRMLEKWNLDDRKSNGFKAPKPLTRNQIEGYYE